jgi:hypothetical protein
MLIIKNNNDYYNHNDNTNDKDYGKNMGAKGIEEVVTFYFCINSKMILIILKCK